MEGCQSIAAGCRSVDVRIQTAVRVVHIAVNLLRIGGSQAVDIADICRTGQIFAICHDSCDDAACSIAILILSADINLRSRAVATNLDGVTLGVRVYEVTRRLEARIQSRQVLTDRIVTLDIGTIAIDMDFLIERITGNQVAIVFGDFTVIVGRDCIGLVARRFIHFAIYGNCRTGLNLHGILRQILDDRLTGICNIGQILQIRDVASILSDVRRVRINLLIYLPELTAVDSIRTVFFNRAILDIGNSRTAFTAQADF